MLCSKGLPKRFLLCGGGIPGSISGKELCLGCRPGLKLKDSSPPVSRQSMSSLAVSSVSAGEQELPARLAKNEEYYHNLMVELSKINTKSEYPYIADRSVNFSLIQNEVSDAVRILSVYEELFTKITEEDSDQILRIYSDKLVEEERAILWSTGSDSKPSNAEQHSNGLPTKTQLQYVHDSLVEQLPRLFKKPIDYTIYSKEVVFINNIRGTTTKGLVPYVKQVAMLRIFGHLKFSYVRFELLKSTIHTDDGTVKIRWRISGVSGLRSMLKFWNIKLWNYKQTRADMSETWYDGFSTFKIGSDGLVHVHIADKVMPDEDRATATEKVPLAATLAILIGLVPRPSLCDFFESKSELERTVQVIERIEENDKCK